MLSEHNKGIETEFARGGIAVVIHRKVTIGKHCMIGQCVTIGGKSGEEILPTIEDMHKSALVPEFLER